MLSLHFCLPSQKRLADSTLAADGIAVAADSTVSHSTAVRDSTAAGNSTAAGDSTAAVALAGQLQGKQEQGARSIAWKVEEEGQRFRMG